MDTLNITKTIIEDGSDTNTTVQDNEKVINSNSLNTIGSDGEVVESKQPPDLVTLKTQNPTDALNSLAGNSMDSFLRIPRTKGETKHIPVDLDDEYNSRPSVEINVLQPIVLETKGTHNQPISVDLTDEVRDEFKYLSATRNLEVEGPRIDIIQSYVNKMVHDNPQWGGGRARVVIMNKGQEPDAFVCPDGTIFISQSLINLLDSLDEVIAVVSHEVKHLTNDTAQAAFNSQTKRGATLGVKWFHEMGSDFGSFELLEKVGLKSTALADAHTKLSDYFGNNRGSQHQAPILRAVQALGAHRVKDYETSHLRYTPIPPELQEETQMTNFESIADAVIRNDTQSVKKHLPKLHPRDFGTFFDIVKQGFWFDLGNGNPDKKTQNEVTQSVKELVVQRLMAEGKSEKEIKLFFLVTPSRHSSLLPSFTNVSEVESYAVLADEMSRRKTIKELNKKLFGHKNGGDPLNDLVNFVNYSFDDFTDEDALLYTDVNSITQFIGTVNNLIQPDLHQEEIFDTDIPSGNTLYADQSTKFYYEDAHGQPKNPGRRSEQIHWKLQNILFQYIERFYLPEIPDGELDQEQIEGIFHEIKTVGFRPSPRMSFPIEAGLIGIENRKIIEEAYKNVFEEELVQQNKDGLNVDPLPTLSEFKGEISGLSSTEASSLLNRYGYIHEFDVEQKAQYVQVGLEYLKGYDFFQKNLRFLLIDALGFHKVNQSLESHSPKTLDNLIEEHGLDKEALYKEALKNAEIERTTSEIEFIADTIASSEEKLFHFLEESMRNTKVDIDSLDQYELLKICKPIFQLASVSGRGFDREKINDFDRFYQLRLVQEIVGKIKHVRVENISDLATYKQGENTRMWQSVNIGFSLYEDDVYSILFAKPFREELSRLTSPGNLSPNDYPALIQLLSSDFPSSPERRDLTKSLQTLYINDPDVSIQEKIDFYFEEYNSLQFEGALLIAEQITDIATYRAFKERLDQLTFQYMSGEESLDKIAVTDIASSILTERADLLIKSASGSEQISQEITTDFAIQWIRTYLSEQLGRAETVEYDINSGKFLLSERGRHAFISLKDTIDFFKNLPSNQKLAIALKAMSDQDGLLVSTEGRELLERTLTTGLDLEDKFLRSALSTGIKKGDAKLVGLPAAQMLVPFMFRALDTQAITMHRVKNATVTDYVNDADYFFVNRKIGTKDYAKDLPRILNASTSDIRYFGHRYKDQPDSFIGRQAQESNSVYFETLNNLKAQIKPKIESAETTEADRLPAVTEAMIRAGETSPIFVRGMQMAVQLIDFDPIVHERLSQTQDSMKGMEKLLFWDNLLSKAKGDPELADFLENDLVSLDSYLGGGSLFTTYGATVRAEDGSLQKVVVKMLNPNAEEFIRLSYDFSANVISEVEQNTRGTTRRNAKLAGSLLDLAHVWCIKDINDSTYAENDDTFRLSVQSYNAQKGRTLIEAPTRRYTSKKVKIEDQYEGITLNKFLARADVPEERKQDAVNTLVGFFDHQFNSAIITPDGTRLYTFHSDPHTGNYMTNPESIDQTLGIIDRSMYITLEEKDVEMFSLLKSGNHAQFINRFIGRCLEVNDIDGNEATGIRYKILYRLVSESIKQKMRSENDTAAYLQIIMQEFSQYGEKWLGVESNDEQSALESLISDYIRNNPEIGSSDAYKNLKEHLTNGKNGTQSTRTLTYPQFRELLGQMQEKGFVRKKTIEVPLEYRLMIRNIIAMQNLKKKWNAGQH